MAEPITWRNVTGTTPAEALRPIQAAQQSFTDSLGSLEKMLLNAQQQATNIETRKLDETEQQYRTFLESFANPNDLLAARAEQQRRFEALDPRIQARVREADEQRFSSLADMRTKELAISDDDRKREEEPIRDNVLTLAYAGNYDNALNVLAQNPNIRDQASLVKAIEDARRTGEEFTWKEAAEKDRVASSKLGRQEAELRIKSAKQAEADAAEQRALENAMASRIRDFRTQQQIIGEQYGVFARQKGFGGYVLPNGRIDIAQLQKLSGTDKTAYDDFRTKARDAGLLPFDNLMISDTQAGDIAFRELAGTGKYSASALEKARAGFRSSFDSNGDPLVGEDKRRADRQAATKQVNLERDIAEGWSLPGSPKAQEMQERLTTDLEKKINTSDGFDSADDLPALRTAIGEVLSQGIEVNGVKVVPSEQLILTALNGANGSWFVDGKGWGFTGRDSKFIAKLKALADTPEMRAQAAKAQANDLADREARIRAIQRGGK